MLREGRGSGTEFRYRAVDERPTPHPPLPPPSGYSYFTEQAIRAGYMAPGFGRMYENFQNPILVQDEIQRELEKERIREEVIAAEVAWRRVLEAEVRREMRLERELAVQGRGGDGFDRLPFLPRAGMRFEPRDLAFGQVEGRSLEERIAMSVGERFGNGARQDIGDYEIVPFQERSVKPKIGGYGTIPSQQRAMEPKIPEVMHSSEVGKEKENILSLEERIAMSLGESFRNGARQEIGDHEIVPSHARSVEPKFWGHETIPFQQRALEPKISEVTHTSEVGKEKEKIVFLV